MEINRDSSILLATYYCKKFGFISKSFFWTYLCPGTTSSRYRYWNLFLKSNLFLPYQEIEKSSKFFYLNHRVTNFLPDGLEPVTRRSPLYFSHDDQIMRVIFLLEKNNLIKQFWTEQELKTNRPLALDLLGGDYSKLPDAICDLNISGQVFRIALEVEMTRKSNDRYFRSFISYSAFSKADLILFGTNQNRITEAIKNISYRRSHINALKPIGFFDLKEFSEKGLAASLDINTKAIPLCQFFNNLIGIKSDQSVKKSENVCEKTEKTFSQNLTKQARYYEP